LTGNLNGQDDFEGDEDSDLDIGGSDKDDHHDDFVGEVIAPGKEEKLLIIIIIIEIV